jgi:hypothetical protein
MNKPKNLSSPQRYGEERKIIELKRIPLHPSGE